MEICHEWEKLMIKEIPEAITIPAKYVFLDVVGFTHERSVEAQSDIVHILNDIVQGGITENEVPKDKLILLPTGDGMCIALLNVESPYDVHLLIALSIVKRVHEHNEEIENEMRKFQVRIGLNSNIDNLVTDINGNRNIAGAGISVASRVMNVADGNQILVGESVFDTLRYREKYMSAFKHYPATVKHEVKLPI
jgi:class 3 adenylate cyclase